MLTLLQAKKLRLTKSIMMPNLGDMSKDFSQSNLKQLNNTNYLITLLIRGLEL